MLRSAIVQPQVNRKASSSEVVDVSLSAEELSFILSALWIWRCQLGRVGSNVPIPGLGNMEARQAVDEMARKLGADPDAYFYGLSPSQRR